MRRFWYFDVLKWSGGKKSCISVLCQNGGFAQHGSILHGLKPQVTPKAALTSQNTTQIRQVSPSDTPRHPHSIRHYRHPRISSNIQGGFLVSQYMRSWTKVEPSYHFSTTLKGKIFLDLIIFRHKNTKTAQYMLSKNHWVRPFFAFFRFVREILFVTVALDPPVPEIDDKL